MRRRRYAPLTGSAGRSIIDFASLMPCSEPERASMSRWLSKASSSTRTASDRPATYFVTCGCGHVLEGVRGDRSWDCECPTCGAHLFVLPRDVFPPVPEPPASKRTPQRRERVEPATEKPEPEAASARALPSRASPARPARSSVRESLATWVRPLRERAADRVRRARPRLTPLRSVALAMAVCMAITGWWMWRLERAARAEQTLRVSLERGAAALEGRDYSTAAVEYAAAAGALDVLRRDDAFANRVRQTSRQLTAMENLLHDPLENVLAETTAGVAGRDGTLRIPFPHAERWLVFDTTVRRAADSARAVYEIDYPLMVDGLPVSLRVRPPAFAGANIDGRPSRVVFAARLANARRGSGETPGLVVELDPHSLFLWTDAESLAELGLEPDEPLLEVQARAVGVGPDESHGSE